MRLLSVEPLKTFPILQKVVLATPLSKRAGSAARSSPAFAPDEGAIFGARVFFDALSCR